MVAAVVGIITYKCYYGVKGGSIEEKRMKLLHTTKGLKKHIEAVKER